jgi:hypothetical protein
MDKCSYKNCNQKPTHVLVDYEHKSIDNKVYCSIHAFLENREKCPCCNFYYIEGTDGLLPTYPNGTLDDEGCCSEHP